MFVRLARESDMTDHHPPPSCHEPVLADEVLELLQLQPGQIVVDGTLGGGGHARRLADRVGKTGRVLGLDRDGDAISAALVHLAGGPIQPIHASYVNLPEVCEQYDIRPVAAVLLDLGLSSDQLASMERGFSFHSDGELDMRFDQGRGQPAWQFLSRINEKDLASVIYEYGEERFSRRIARAIVEHRQERPIRSAQQLATLVARAVPRRRQQRIHPATRTFQALRIVVNDELRLLERTLQRVPTCIQPGGRVAIISYHSLEDRIVKNAFRDDVRFDIITRKPVRPSDEEVTRNPRSRSARLRVACIAGN
jgi:16S rRNA (cytosine1402-N4)-methyltransferase